MRLKKIVVGTDFQSSSERALRFSEDLVTDTPGCELIVVHVFELPAQAYAGIEYSMTDWLEPLERQAKQHLDQYVSACVKRGIPARGVLGFGQPCEHILATAEKEGADLIVVGTHGRRGVVHLALGSVAERLVRLSPIPVVTIRAESGRAAA